MFHKFTVKITGSVAEMHSFIDITKWYMHQHGSVEYKGGWVWDCNLLVDVAQVEKVLANYGIVNYKITQK